MTNSGREELNEYLEKPLELEANQLSTSVNFSATSLSSGGIEGLLLIRKNGKIVVQDSTTNRILLGTQKGGF
jgi:hypothetical protein